MSRDFKQLSLPLHMSRDFKCMILHLAAYSFHVSIDSNRLSLFVNVCNFKNRMQDYLQAFFDIDKIIIQRIDVCLIVI